MNTVKKSKLEFFAQCKADIDWQHEGSNCNPYNAETNPVQHKAYEDRMDQIDHEWEQSFRGAK